MLESVKIARRQSEIRQTLATLAAKPQPTEDETRQMDALDGEYRTNETRYRAALIAEDSERRDAGADLETRGGREWSDLCAGFELRQAALHLDEGRALTGRTAEVVAELRGRGGYRGVPVPLEALERRAGETVSTGVPAPRAMRPIIDRLFPESAAARMGSELINIGAGETEHPVATSGATVGWQATETGAVGGPSVYATSGLSLKPEHTLGATMKITRRSLLQVGGGLEAAIRRDMSAAIESALDKVVFLGAGASGEPLGVVSGAATYGVTVTPLAFHATYKKFREAIVRFMLANAVTSPSQVRVLMRPETWSALDAQASGGHAPSWEYERLTAAVGAGSITLSANALAAPAGDPLTVKALLATSSGGVPPIYIGMWGGVDLIRDPYSDAASGGLRLTALATVDVTIGRAPQLQVLTDIRELAEDPGVP
jgi:HK97 family phage major capsid protein